MKRLGAGGRLQGGGCAKGGQMRQDVLDAALSLLDGISPDRHTQNRSLCYKRLERPAHRVSMEKENARYFFC